MSSFKRVVSRPSEPPTQQDQSSIHLKQETETSSKISDEKDSTRPSVFAEEAQSSSGPGTKSGLGGLTWVSTGSDDLDKIFGGGVALGTVTVILQVLITISAKKIVIPNVYINIALCKRRSRKCIVHCQGHEIRAAKHVEYVSNNLSRNLHYFP